MIYIVMGVSGSGKSTVGKLLAEKLNLTFVDADDYHSTKNIDMMRSGKPLKDDDRSEWLHDLNKILRQNEDKGMVLACSALKEQHREIIKNDINAPLRWILLIGTDELLQKRLELRKDHFMPAGLLQSQLDILESPDYALQVDISDSPDDIVNKILEHYNQK